VTSLFDASDELLCGGYTCDERLDVEELDGDSCDV